MRKRYDRDRERFEYDLSRHRFDLHRSLRLDLDASLLRVRKLLRVLN